jgi:glycosyltransferase involved in cell wall biosynthesis
MSVLKDETASEAVGLPDFPEAIAAVSSSDHPFKVALLTGGGDKPYVLGIVSSLIAQGVALDLIGSNELDLSQFHQSPLIKFLNLRGDTWPDATTTRKVLRILSFYGRLFRYTATATPRVFHILWNNKFELFDRTLLLLYYRLFGKRIVMTVHNVNAAHRDKNDSLLNRLTLRVQYRLAERLFVHTKKMKQELRTDFGVPEHKISIIPFGINSTVPITDVTSAEARQRLSIPNHRKVVLFFGRIAPYKGLQYLIDAMVRLIQTAPDYHLIIAGRVEKGCGHYWKQLQFRISSARIQANLTERIEHVPDAETEIYFKAADALVLPYTHIFQSGVLFLAYNFGLPVIASDVGSLKEDVVEGKTGFVCKPCDPIDLAKSVEAYFSSELYRQLETRRREIRVFAEERYSWNRVGEITLAAYRNLLAKS